MANLKFKFIKQESEVTAPLTFYMLKNVTGNRIIITGTTVEDITRYVDESSVTGKMDKTGGAFTGDVTAPTFIGDLEGNAESAGKLEIARNFTIGSSDPKSFTGEQDLTFTLTEMGLKTASKAEALSGAPGTVITPTTFRNMVAFITGSGGGTINLNLQTSRNYHYTLSSTTSFGAPTNHLSGDCGDIMITMAANVAISWASVWKFLGSIPSINTSGERWVISYKVVDATNIIASAEKLAN